MDHQLDSSDEVIYLTPLKQNKKKKLLISIASLLVIGVLVVIDLSNTQIQGVGTYRNYSADAIVQGGAITEKELLQKYDQNASGIQSIYNHYGITRSDLTGQTSDIRHGVVYQDGTIKVDGKTVATGAYSVSRKAFYDHAGNAPRTVKINGTTLYEGPNMSIFVKSVDAFVYFRNGQFYKAAISSCANPVMGNPTEKPTPKPEPKPEPKLAVFKCTGLTADRINRTLYRFTAGATAQNAEITSYTFNFNDGSTPQPITSKVAEHTFKPGTYKVKVTIAVKADGTTKTDTNSDCEKTITIAEAPKTPVAACDRLTTKPIQGKDNTYAYTLIYTAEPGAKLTKAIYNFGDGSSKTFKASDATNVEHQYAGPGTYKTTTTLYFDVTEEGKTSEKSATCTATIAVPKPENCPLPGKEDLPKNSPDCVEPLVETPPELPQTGLGEWFAGGAGLAALAAAGYYWNTSRKNLAKTMLKK